MRQWRVGTFSMGLLLLATGIGLLYGQFKAYPAAEYLLQWWPLIFILLGLEVLLHTYFNKVEDGRIKYDVFSIFIVFIIVMTGLSLQAASHLGLTSYVQKNITAERFYLQTDQEIALGNNIQKLVIQTERCSQLDIRTGPGDAILCNARVAIRAGSKSEAEQELGNRVQVKTSSSGNTMYLRLGFSVNEFDSKYTLVLPQRVAVEIEHDDARLDIANARLSNDWLIKGNGATDISLASPTDVMVSVLLPENQNVVGNLNWNTLSAPAVKDAVANEAEGGENNDIHKEGSNEAVKTIESKVGNGTHQMTVIRQGGGKISINQLP